MAQPRDDVFIGSTKDDLKDYRQAVIDAVLSLELHPIGMEHWPAEDAQAVEVCQRKVSDAEIYVGIFAHRYGWQPDGHDGKSITELEYEWAGEKGIPRLCFIVEDGYPWSPDYIEMDKQAELKAFKARVQDEVIVNFFTTPEDLARQVTSALAPFAGKSGGSAALTPYLNWLHSEAKKSGLLRVMDASTVDPSRAGQQVTVDEVYTPLDTHSTVYVSEHNEIVWDIDHRDLKEDFETRPLSAMEAANFHEQFVLLGDPGSGKSTFVNFLALCLAGAVVEAENGWLEHLEKQGWRHGVLLPVRVVLREFAEALPADAAGTVQALMTFIEAEVARHGCTDAAQLHQVFNRGEALLLLDGLDEVPNDKREAVRDGITDFISAYPKSRVMVTCRILSYANPMWQIPGLPQETLAPFNLEQIERFVGAWYTASKAAGLIGADDADSRIKDLKQALHDNQLEGPAANPMLLTVMALVHNHTGSLPRENARLYAECVELLMFRWKPVDAGWLKDELNAREDDIYRALWELAYIAHEEQADKTGPADITESTVIGVMRKRFGDIEKAQLFCKYVEERAGLLVGRGESRDGWKVFTFPHRTFQEYLAGCHIANGRRSLRRRFKEKALSGAGWREVLLLAAGHLIFNDTDIESTIDAVAPLIQLEPEQDDHWRGVWLASDIFNLIGRERVVVDEEGRDLLPLAQNRLAELVSEGHLEPVERAAAGRALGQLGDLRRGVGLTANGLPDIDWVEIPAGAFLMGSGKTQDRRADYNETPQQRFELDTYHIARYPVTVAQYAAFVDAGGYANSAYWTEAGWEWRQGNNIQAPAYWNDEQWHISNHPVIGVSWYEAFAYCQWVSEILGYEVRLPTEAEWEKTARGTDERIYSYPGGYDPSKANTRETLIGRTSAVGLFPDGASPYGALDVSGNVWEWCGTKVGGEFFSPEFWDYADGLAAMNDDPKGDSLRVLRGGSWLDDRYFARAAYRNRVRPSNRAVYLGFRVCCAVRPPSRAELAQP